MFILNVFNKITLGTNVIHTRILRNTICILYYLDVLYPMHVLTTGWENRTLQYLHKMYIFINYEHGYISNV